MPPPLVAPCNGRETARRNGLYCATGRLSLWRQYVYQPVCVPAEAASSLGDLFRTDDVAVDMVDGDETAGRERKDRTATNNGRRPLQGNDNDKEKAPHRTAHKKVYADRERSEARKRCVACGLSERY